MQFKLALKCDHTKDGTAPPLLYSLFFKKETLTLEQNLSYESFYRIIWSRNTKGQKVWQPRKGNCKRKVIIEGCAENTLSTSTSEKAELSSLKNKYNYQKNEDFKAYPSQRKAFQGKECHFQCFVMWKGQK